jgi:hypothetical protein
MHSPKLWMGRNGDDGTPAKREATTFGNKHMIRAAPPVNPVRITRLVERARDSFDLNLEGTVVLTEAASGAFAVTAAIAAVGGAEQVICVSGDSEYSSMRAAVEETLALAEICGVRDRIRVEGRRSLDVFSEADLVTNLGFVRPIDYKAVARLKTGAVVTVMHEAWELRGEDIDLDACKERDVLVLATNEEAELLDIFPLAGTLCLKMLFDAHVEVRGAKILLVGEDKFVYAIREAISSCGGIGIIVPDLAAPLHRESLEEADALVVADYVRTTPIIADDGDISPSVLQLLAPQITLVQYAGRSDTSAVEACGIPVYPSKQLQPHRMALTTAALGPRPVVDLHTAGLKVGEIGVRTARENSDIGVRQRIALAQSPLVQAVLPLRIGG